MLSNSIILLEGMPWNILTPMFLLGVTLGIVLANRTRKARLNDQSDNID